MPRDAQASGDEGSRSRWGHQKFQIHQAPISEDSPQIIWQRRPSEPSGRSLSSAYLVSLTNFGLLSEAGTSPPHKAKVTISPWIRNGAHEDFDITKRA